MLNSCIMKAVGAYPFFLMCGNGTFSFIFFISFIAQAFAKAANCFLETETNDTNE